MSHELTLLMDDLAAHWTDPVLEMVMAVGTPYVSIDIEIAAWHIVKESLDAELQRTFQRATLVSLPVLMERVLRRAAEQVMLRIAPHAVTPIVKTHLLRLAGERRATGAERVVYARIIREPALRSAFKPPSVSDFTPRLRVSPTLFRHATPTI